MSGKKKQQFGIFPPCVDAYIKSYDDRDGITFRDFGEHMKSHASQWGEQAIGATLFQTGKVPMTEDGKAIVCIGWYGDRGSFAVTAPLQCEQGSYWFEKLEVIPFEWPGEWDAT